MVARGFEPIGVGYEGRDVDGLLAVLGSRGVEVLVDVRLNPLSRKRGLSKKALSERLAREGIEYRHEPALGNPRDNRDGYADLHGEPAEQARSAFRARLETDEARAALDRIRAAGEARQVALLCFEADEAHCHREQILDRLRALEPVAP
ncbi:DUF488 family protein [Clavibacter sp. Sh2126]|uniref:DUF488 domain-containing protein n=1 Tax=Clavibacter sp. Sh2126 TaxID=3397678 RepID=UPI0039E106DE